MPRLASQSELFKEIHSCFNLSVTTAEAVATCLLADMNDPTSMTTSVAMFAASSKFKISVCKLLY